jgi:hypothetical protein
MPLAPGLGGRYGLGVWNSIPLTYLVEGSLWLAGIAVYLSMTSARDRWGTYGFWAVIALLTGISVASISGPPPPGILTVAFGNVASLIVFAWAYWIDRHRFLIERRLEPVDLG